MPKAKWTMTIEDNNYYIVCKKEKLLVFTVYNTAFSDMAKRYTMGICNALNDIEVAYTMRNNEPHIGRYPDEPIL